MTDWLTARCNMVESQIKPNAVTDQRLISALLAVPRELFVPTSMHALTYCDLDIDISVDASEDACHILAPMTFARMIQLASIHPTDHVLDIGCASGYSSAVLSSIAGSVVAIEQDDGMVSRAQDTLTAIGADNVAVVQSNLNSGLGSQGPYDAIILEGAVEEIPESLFGQLSDGGRLVAALRSNGIDTFYRFVRSNGEISGSSAFGSSVRMLRGFECEQGFVF